ncbi:MAG: hypothetical protein KDK39_17910 [Leptospiraceae bacterium]|nr:hypothetical protein [Leptospiraceae bacterium]
MTAQFQDRFTLRGRGLDIAGVSGQRLFDPQQFGLQPVSNCTACWNGYLCYYALQDQYLVLDKLHVNLFQPHLQWERETGPVIQGVAPVDPGRDGWFNNVYHDLSLLVSYSGGLLCTDGFIQKYYAHMGFHPAWKYEYVAELLFEDGRLCDEQDRSLSMAAVRQRVDANQKAGSSGNALDIETQVLMRSSFDCHYF